MTVVIVVATILSVKYRLMEDDKSCWKNNVFLLLHLAHQLSNVLLQLLHQRIPLRHLFSQFPILLFQVDPVLFVSHAPTVLDSHSFGNLVTQTHRADLAQKHEQSNSF
jgi:hypothetical protein